MTSDVEITVVGGSLAGLTLALACAARGMPVRVLEQSKGHVLGGDSLTVDLSLLRVMTGHDPRLPPALPVVPAYRDLTTWPALYSWLQARVNETPTITLEGDRRVLSVTDLGEGVEITFEDGKKQITPVVLGADGYRSVVRRAIAPDHPYARYAGYLVWRGLVEERTLKRPVPWPSDGGLWIEIIDGYRLVAATLPGRDGSLVPGHRQITFAWFDVHQEQLLRRTGCLTLDGHIVGSLARGMIDESVRLDLASRARAIWPELWLEAVLTGISSPETLSGAPIAEYKPERLARGNLAILGDAAHVISPMTGRGLLTGMEDASTLAQLLASRNPKGSFASVLGSYEQARLPFIQGLVNHSMSISAEYRRRAGV